MINVWFVLDLTRDEIVCFGFIIEIFWRSECKGIVVNLICMECTFVLTFYGVNKAAEMTSSVHISNGRYFYTYGYDVCL